jgi:hypothetical protein
MVDAAVRFPDAGGLGHVSVEVRAAGTTGPYQGAPETVEVVCAIAAKRGRQSTARWPGLVSIAIIQLLAEIGKGLLP